MADKEVEFERTYDAPADKVWQAWTDPKQLEQWWGPDNVTIPECDVDLRVGGKFKIVMEAGEAMGDYKGTRWPMDAEYTVVEPNNRLTYASIAWTEGSEETTKIEQLNELTLHEDGGKTTLKLKITVNSVGPDAGMAIQGMQYGFNQMLDKLTTHLG